MFLAISLLARSWRRGAVLGLLAALFAPLQAQSGEALSPRNANYEIQVTLNPETKILDGRETIRWRNITEATASDLWFHLYYNAWRNSESTWLQEDELRRNRGLGALTEEDWGYVDVLSLELVGPEGRIDLMPQLRYESPDDDNSADRTVMAVNLPREVLPGEEIQLEARFRSKVPKTFARTGFQGNFFFLGQWFPKLGVFQNDGTWNCHQFHASTEFFSDYGIYDVSMTVPQGWLLGATGKEQSRLDNGDGTTTHRYLQADVHDFAWTTSPDYREAKARFEVPGLQPVEMRLLYQPEHESQIERHFAGARAALQYYGGWYGEYPYDHITLIDPAYDSGAGGMEYPTLYTCGTRYFNPEGGGSPEGVTVHENGHQFWYGIVGNNEFENAWMDEGLNTFSTARTMETAFGESAYVRRYFQNFFPVLVPSIRESRMIQGNRMDGYRRVARGDTQATFTFRYFPGNASAITYNKTALWLSTLERSLGWDTLRSILSTFFQRWKFKHPKPQDFFDVANEVSGKDLSPFFDQVYRNSAVFDYGIASVSSEPVKLRGWVMSGNENVYSSGENTEQDPDSAREPIFDSRVVVRRYKDGIFPVEVLLHFEDGQDQRQVWDGRKEWTEIRVKRPSRLQYAVVDPDRKLLLDINYTNNSRLLEARNDLPATKWASKWMIWLQDYMQTMAAVF